MNETTVSDCKEIKLNQFSGRIGRTSQFGDLIGFPFSAKRIFYLYDIPGGESRGAHAHKCCHQFLIAICGSFEVLLDDGKEKRKISLQCPDRGLHIPPGIWASEVNFSAGAICLVMASHLFEESDYIRTYSFFKNYKITNNDSNHYQESDIE